MSCERFAVAGRLRGFSSRVYLSKVRVRPQELVRGIDCVSRAGAEAVLLVRGGGSYEDLMPFNDEGLARAIAACPVPVVTGIGHEPDTTIADLVADVRASTPTGAAEAVSPLVCRAVGEPRRSCAGNPRRSYSKTRPLPRGRRPRCHPPGI